MHTQQNNNSNSHEQQPAQESSEATVRGLYMTKTGKVGVEIRESASGRFRYMGAWGAGGGLSRRDMGASLRAMLGHRRGYVVKVAFVGAEADA
jgi:hypothetical protein